MEKNNNNQEGEALGFMGVDPHRKGHEIIDCVCIYIKGT